MLCKFINLYYFYIYKQKKVWYYVGYRNHKGENSMSFDENTNVAAESGFINPSAETKKKKDKKKVKSYSRRSSERTTIGLLVAILAVGICLLCVSIAGMIGVSNNLQKAPVEETTTAQNIQNNLQQNTPVVNTPVITETTTAAENQDTETTTAPENTDNSSAPSTDAEWLEFFNTAVNKLKSDAPAMTKSKQTKTADIKLSNSLGNAYVSAAKDKYLSDETVETPIAKGDKAAAQANVSPDGAAYVSTLTLADIKSITGSVNADGNYEIKIAMNDVSNPDLNSSYAKVFQFMLVDDVMNKYAPDMGATVDRSNVELKYSKCSATATISPDGKVIAYETMVNANMILRDAKVKVINTDLDATLYSVTKYYNIEW